MELPAYTSSTTSRELEQLAKEQALGEAANVGCPGFETTNAVTTTISGAPTKISGTATISRGGQTSTGTTTIPRSRQTSTAAATIPTSPATARAASKPGGATSIRSSTWKS